MQTLAKAQIIGRLGKDPERKGVVAVFSVATDGKKTKEGEKTTDWHRCVAFGKTADFVLEHAKKGDLVMVEGRLQFNEWEGKRYHEIMAGYVNLLSSSESKQAQASREKPQPYSDYGNEAPF